MSRWPSELVAAAWSSRWRARLRTWRNPSSLCLAPPLVAANSPLGVPVHDEALLQWRRWCEAHEGRHVRLGLSARWLLSTALPDAARGGVARAQAQGEVVSRWSHFLSMDDAVWHERWVTRAVNLPQGVLVCAVPRALVDDVLAVAAHHHVAVQWLGPWWAQRLNGWLMAGQAGTSARALMMREPGWAVHVQACGAQVRQLWGEPDAGEPCVEGEAVWMASSDEIEFGAMGGQPSAAQVLVDGVAAVGAKA